MNTLTHKCSKYIYKLQQTPSTDPKFGIYLYKLNDYYNQIGGGKSDKKYISDISKKLEQNESLNQSKIKWLQTQIIESTKSQINHDIKNIIYKYLKYLARKKEFTSYEEEMLQTLIKHDNLTFDEKNITTNKILLTEIMYNYFKYNEFSIKNINQLDYINKWMNNLVIICNVYIDGNQRINNNYIKYILLILCYFLSKIIPEETKIIKPPTNLPLQQREITWLTTIIKLYPKYGHTDEDLLSSIINITYHYFVLKKNKKTSNEDDEKCIDKMVKIFMEYNNSIIISKNIKYKLEHIIFLNTELDDYTPIYIYNYIQYNMYYILYIYYNNLQIYVNEYFYDIQNTYLFNFIILNFNKNNIKNYINKNIDITNLIKDPTFIKIYNKIDFYNNHTYLVINDYDKINNFEIKKFAELIYSYPVVFEENKIKIIKIKKNMIITEEIISNLLFIMMMIILTNLKSLD
jgi:hypothetical protein